MTQNIQSSFMVAAIDLEAAWRSRPNKKRVTAYPNVPVFLLGCKADSPLHVSCAASAAERGNACVGLSLRPSARKVSRSKCCRSEYVSPLAACKFLERSRTPVHPPDQPLRPPGLARSVPAPPRAARAYRHARARRTVGRSASARRWRRVASPRCGRRSGLRRADRG